MNAHKLTAKLSKDGELVLTNLPFYAGETVEVIVLAPSNQPNSSQSPLEGSVIRYDEPFESAVSTEDWEALK
ncbi:UNVERIFIED_CONTAM: hypothetical protein BEN50_08985 [Euhalothece sp. KZN 001]